jgi:hypothetical protein
LDEWGVNNNIGKARLIKANRLPDQTAFFGNGRTNRRCEPFLVSVSLLENHSCTDFFYAVVDQFAISVAAVPGNPSLCVVVLNDGLLQTVVCAYEDESHFAV